MSWISPVELNMSISRNIYECRSDIAVIAIAQKIATYLVIPLALIVFFEAVVKNLVVFNLINLSIVVINSIREAWVRP